MTFNEILTQERKRRGLSQEELAGMVNVSRQAVSKWETGDAMPDLNKLLALADALGISLDELCGRDINSTELPPASHAPRKTVRLLAAACILLCIILAGAIILLLSLSAPSPAHSPSPLNLTEAFSVSGLNFYGRSENLLIYQFSPSISGDGLSYQITFTDSWGNAYSFDSPCSGGVCYGEAKLEYGILGYDVTVCVSDGYLSRNLAVARGLNFSLGRTSWTPIDS